MKNLRLSTLSLTLAIAVMTLGYVNVASAGKPTCPGDHPSCKEAGDDGYSVTIKWQVEGHSTDNWLLGSGGKKSIGLNDATAGPGHDVGDLTDLSFFTDSSGPFLSDGDFCFSDPAELHQATIKQGKGGRAQAAFWFDGKTNDGNTSVLYALALFGADGSGADLPGEATLDMKTWELKVENESKTIKYMSCQSASEEDVLVPVTITVTPVDTS